MSDWLTVKYVDKEARRARVNGIYESREQAEAICDMDASRMTDMFAKPEKYSPRIGDAVQVSAGELTPENPRFGDWLSNLTKTSNKASDFDLAQFSEQRSVWKAVVESENKLEEARKEIKVLAAKLEHFERLEREKQSTKWGTVNDRRTTAYQSTKVWVSETTEQAREQLISDFQKDKWGYHYRRAILAPDGPTARQLNIEAQASKLCSEDAQMFPAVVHHDTLFHKNDRVIFDTADRETGVRAGDSGTIIHVDEYARGLVVHLDYPNTREESVYKDIAIVNLNEYPNIVLGYATTYQRAFDLNIRDAFVLADKESASPQLLENHSAKQMHFYCDPQTADKYFRHLLVNVERTSPNSEQNLDPLAEYNQER